MVATELGLGLPWGERAEQGESEEKRATAASLNSSRGARQRGHRERHGDDSGSVFPVATGKRGERELTGGAPVRFLNIYPFLVFIPFKQQLK